MHPKLSNDRAIRIVNAAREEFATRGYDGARVDRIARMARTNKQLLFYYYHSKRGLFQTVLGEAASRFGGASGRDRRRPGPPLERLREALQTQFEYLASHATHAALLAQAGRSEVRPLGPALKRLVVLVAEGQGRWPGPRRRGPTHRGRSGAGAHAGLPGLGTASGDERRSAGRRRAGTGHPLEGRRCPPRHRGTYGPLGRGQLDSG